MVDIRKLRPGDQARQSSLPFDGLIKMQNSRFRLNPKVSQEIGGNREKLLHFLGGLLTDQPWGNDFAGLIVRRLGWKQVGRGELVRIFEDDGYLAAEITLHGDGKTVAGLAIMVPLRHNDMRVMETLLRENKVPDELRRSGLLARNYGIFTVQTAASGATVPVYVREYIRGETLHSLIKRGGLTDRHIIALGAVFGRLIVLSEQINMHMINLEPRRFIFTESGKGIKVRITNLSETTAGTGPIAYLRRGLNEKLFRAALTRRGWVGKFTDGMISELPKKLSPGMALLIGAEKERAAEELADLRKGPRHEWIRHKNERIQLVLYLRMLDQLLKTA